MPRLRSNSRVDSPDVTAVTPTDAESETDVAPGPETPAAKKAPERKPTGHRLLAKFARCGEPMPKARNEDHNTQLMGRLIR